MTTKVLTGKDVLLIKATRTEREYSSEKEGYKGKKYTVFASTQGAFAVHEDEVVEFNEGLKASNEDQIAEVHFNANDEGQLSLVSWLTWGQINSLKSNEVFNESITVESAKIKSVKELAELA